MNLDGSCKIRRTPVVGPVVIGEPRTRIGHRHQLARARMIEIEDGFIGRIINAFDSRQALQHFPHLRLQPRLRYIDMRDLMVGHGKRFRDRRIQQFAAVLLPHRQKAGVTQRAIDVDRPVDARDAVFGQHDDRASAGARRFRQIAGDRVDLAQGLSDRGMGFVRTETLQVVVQMRQIGQGKGRIVLGHDQLGGFGDPSRRCDRRGRPPELKQRKRTEPLGQAIPQAGRHGVAIRQLAPVGLVDRPRCRAEIMA